MARLHPSAAYTIKLIDPKGLDKVARGVRVQPSFSAGQIYAPMRKWSAKVIDEMAIFPRGKFDDLTDSATQAIWWLRQNGYLIRQDEMLEAQLREASNYHQQLPLYPT